MLNKILKVLAVAMLIGVSMTLIGIFAFGGEVQSIPEYFNDDDSYTLVQHSDESEITNINIIAVNRRIEISLSSDDSWHLDYYDSEKDRFDYSFIDGELVLENIIQRQYFTIFKWTSAEISLVKLTVPVSFSGNIIVKTTNGSIKTEDLSLINQINFETTNGSLTIENVVVLNDVSLFTTNGGINVLDSRIDQELYNRTTNGNINLRNVVAIDIDSVTTNGKIIASIVGDSDEFKMDLRVTNGKIYLGDFVLASQVLNPTKTNIIRLHTTNGNIEIEFVE
ncbi:MAG: DUF4097 family beta strand repeat-containing protein, partial [Bacilli bacterium]|nr:DUF4097 family beta strand repeat-containing protein [Bacilli bacterium]